MMSKKPFQRVILFARQHRANEGVNETLQRLITFLKERHIETFVDQDTATHFDLHLPCLTEPEMDPKRDLIVVVGGDGSIHNFSGGIINNDGGLLGVGIDAQGGPYGSGTLVNDAGATVNNYGFLWNKGAALTNQGALNNFNYLINKTVLDNGGSFNNSGGVLNLGLLSNGSSGSFYNAQSALTANVGQFINEGTFNNVGTLVNSGGGVLKNYGSLDNGGTIKNYSSIYNRSGGTVYNSGTIDNASKIFNDSGTFNNTAGGTLNNQYFKNDATVVNASGATINNNYRFINNGVLSNGGTLNLLNVSGTTGGYYGLQNFGSLTNSGEIDVGSAAFLVQIQLRARGNSPIRQVASSR